MQGFSLLELMLVLALLGLMTALSVAWLGPASSIGSALEQLAAQSRQLAQQAQLSGRILGLRWTGQHPQPVQLKLNEGRLVWTPLDSSTQGWADWPQELRPDRPAAQEPWVIFTPSGLAQPVQVRWSWPEGGERWHWHTSTRIQVQPAL